MFEKAHPFSVSSGLPAGRRRPEERPTLRGSALAVQYERFESRGGKRAGDALRAVQWSEITARLNAARDLRLLLRSASQAPIEAVAASFGDAAASYFALLDSNEPAVGHGALGQSKALSATLATNEASRSGGAPDESSDAPRGDAREMQ